MEESGFVGHIPVRSHSMGEITSSPSRAQTSVDGASGFVTWNQSDQIIEIHETQWKVQGRISAAAGVDDLATSKDDRSVLATNKPGQSFSVLDIKSDRELGRPATKRKLPGGVALGPDCRYAFIAVEGVGAEPGPVEILDVESLHAVATVDVPEQAVDLWKTEP